MDSFSLHIVSQWDNYEKYTSCKMEFHHILRFMFVIVLTTLQVGGLVVEDQKNDPREILILCPVIFCWVGPKRKSSLEPRTLHDELAQQIRRSFTAVRFDFLGKVLSLCFPGCRSVCKMAVCGL
jgi:hypothetical protein